MRAPCEAGRLARKAINLLSGGVGKSSKMQGKASIAASQIVFESCSSLLSVSWFPTWALGVWANCCEAWDQLLTSCAALSHSSGIRAPNVDD